MRDEKGRFLPGNPGGGRPKMPREFLNALQDQTEAALSVILDVMNDQEAKPELRFKAAAFVLEHAYGHVLQAEQLEQLRIANVIRELEYLQRHPENQKYLDPVLPELASGLPMAEQVKEYQGE